MIPTRTVYSISYSVRYHLPVKQDSNKRPSRAAEANASRSATAAPRSAAADCAGGDAERRPLRKRATASATPFRSVGFTVSSIGYGAARRFRETLAPLKLEPREFALLRGVSAAEGDSQQAIGERMQIPPSRMVAFVDALEARGLLERRANPQDRRSWALHLTRDGREVLESAFTLASGFEQSLCADLSAAEREQLIDMLRRVGHSLGISGGTHAAHADSIEAER